MTIVKFTVDKWNDKVSRQEYCKETAHFYMHLRGRGRTPKSSLYIRHFDTEAQAIEYIEQRKSNRIRSKEVDRIKSCALELLEALDGMMKCFDDGVGADWNSKELDAARTVIAKAKGES